MTPLISVVLPVYNRPHVTKTIFSVLNQSYEKFELIIIDNCSTDSTVDEIKKVDDARIRLYVNEQNFGQTYSLNRGINLSRGKYIARIDSDDLMAPDRLEKQVSFMENHLDYVICGSTAKIISDDDEVVGKMHYCEDDYDIKFASTFYCPFAHPAVMIRRETLLYYNLYYDEGYRIAEDYDMWARLLKFGKGYNIQEPLLLYRMGKNNDSSRHRDILKTESFNIIRYINDNYAWSGYNKSAFEKLINYAEETNKSLLRILYTYYGWYKYIKSSDGTNKQNYQVIKSNYFNFMISSCFLDNDRKSVKCTKLLISKARKMIRRITKGKT